VGVGPLRQPRVRHLDVDLAEGGATACRPQVARFLLRRLAVLAVAGQLFEVGRRNGISLLQPRDDAAVLPETLVEGLDHRRPVDGQVHRPDQPDVFELLVAVEAQEHSVTGAGEDFRHRALVLVDHGLGRARIGRVGP
jgi:hypothetical protein